MDTECWLCDGRIKDGQGATVPSLGITVHRRCLRADQGEEPEPLPSDDLNDLQTWWRSAA